MPDRFVFAAEDARRLAAMRIGLFGLLAVRLATTDFASVAGQPRTLFDPVSLFKLLTSMPSPGLTSVVQVLAVLAALLAAAGLWSRVSFPSAFALALFLHLMQNATGKIIHNDVLLTLCLLPLVVTPTAASRVWSLNIPGRREASSPTGRPLIGEAYGWPIRAAMVIVALAYLFVGLQKLRYSGIEWATSDNLRWVLYASSDAATQPNHVALFVADRSWLAHVLAGGSLFLEVGFWLCLPFPRLRWVFIPGAVSMHLGIYLAMGLDYSAQALTVVIVFVNWAVVAEWFQRRTHATPAANAT